MREGRSRAIYSDIMGCEQGCDVAAAGWPLPYLIDYPGISVAGSADLLGALVGEDRFRPLPFAGAALIWTAIVALGFALWQQVTRSLGILRLPRPGGVALRRHHSQPAPARHAFRRTAHTSADTLVISAAGPTIEAASRTIIETASA